MKEPFHIVLVHPEIPQNTGGIGRLCVSTGSRLQLVEPLGFSLEDKYLRRAGMDYWHHLAPTIHPDWEAFLAANPGRRMFFFTTKGKHCFWDTAYRPGDALVFGAESAGLPPEMYDRYRDSLRTIPMMGGFHRSLNLANSVAIALFEALRQNRMEVDA